MLTPKQKDAIINQITLQHVRKMGLFHEIDPPEIVYHMTPLNRLQKILADGKIKAVDEQGHKSDYMTYFFTSLEYIPAYIEITGADRGRQYNDFDGQIHTAPPLDHANTVILKLKPRGRQVMEWYIERIKTDTTIHAADVIEITKLFDSMRVCHFGDMAFFGNPEVIPLTEVDKLPPSKALIRYREIKANCDK